MVIQILRWEKHVTKAAISGKMAERTQAVKIYENQAMFLSLFVAWAK